MTIVKKWCCGCDLLQGGIILGWVETVTSAIIFLLIACCAASGDIMKQMARNAIDNEQYSEYEDTNKLTKEEFENAYTVFTYFNIVMWIWSIYRLLLLVSSLLLLIGTMNKQRSFLMAYLIIEPFNMILISVLALVCVVAFKSVLMITIMLGLLAWDIYAYLCIVSLYQEMQYIENRPAAPILLHQTGVHTNVYTANPTAYPINMEYNKAPPAYPAVNYPRLVNESLSAKENLNV